MDDRTLKIYSENAAEFAARYDSCDGGISAYFAEAFGTGSGLALLTSPSGKSKCKTDPSFTNPRILDIGCGSGRDLRVLHDMGFSADGVDACPELAEIATASLNCGDARVFVDSLPELAEIADDSYDGVLCSAVLMHLPKEELFDAVFAVRRILKEHGRLLLSIPQPVPSTQNSSPKTHHCPPTPNRDSRGRLFSGILPEELKLMLERLGFRLLNRWISDDSLNRAHRKWATMLFELESATGERPIDTIESILSKDVKVATYKLALFRALANIATTNYKAAIWTRYNTVEISTRLLAENWIEYYWPVLEAGIKQTTGRPVAFRKPLEALIDFYRSRGGLSAFTLQFRNGLIPKEAQKIVKNLVSSLRRTIWGQPVRYAGGGEDFSILGYNKQNQHVVIPAEIWQELCLMGTWIQDATILRWAELTARINKNEIKASQVIDCLLTTPIQERDVSAAKSFYDSLGSKECVWSGRPLLNKYELDHAIPFSLWKNNDLWNLLPADPQVNGSKSDRLPTFDTVKKRKDCIIYYWKAIHAEFPSRFAYEAAKFTGTEKFTDANWENRLFATFSEAIETTAIQRGVGRWEPDVIASDGKSHNRSCRHTPSAYGDTDNKRRINVHMSRKRAASDFETDIPTIELPFYPDSEMVCGKSRSSAAELVEDSSLDEGSGFQLLEFGEIKNKAYECYLPFVGKLTASTDLTAGFAIEDLDAESSEAPWIEVDPKECKPKRFVVQVVGDSMEPTIDKFDYVVCEYHRRPYNSTVVVMSPGVTGLVDGDCAVKRISEDADNWIFSSDNPKYDPIIVPKDFSDGYPIIGEVVYNISKQTKVK